MAAGFDPKKEPGNKQGPHLRGKSFFLFSIRRGLQANGNSIKNWKH